MPRLLLVLLLLVNTMVLLGQIRPEDAPPFARTVNIVFLSTTLVVFGWLLARRRTPR